MYLYILLVYYYYYMPSRPDKIKINLINLRFIFLSLKIKQRKRSIMRPSAADQFRRKLQFNIKEKKLITMSSIILSRLRRSIKSLLVHRCGLRATLIKVQSEMRHK